MVVYLSKLFQIFTNQNSNLMPVYPISLDRNEIDISVIQVLDDIPCYYQCHGETHMCHMVVAVTQDSISISFDLEPKITLKMPLYEYDMTEITEFMLYDICERISCNIDIEFAMSISEFKHHYDELD